MTTMTRTDIHRPSAPEFDPETYIVRGFADFHDTDGYRPVQIVSALVDEGYSFRGAPHGSGQCSHCGATLRYAALMSHEPTKTLLYVGETCLDNRFSTTAAEFARMRKEAAAKAEATRRLGKAHDFFVQHPDLVDLTYIQNIRVAGGVEIAYDYYEGTEYANEDEARAAGVSENALGVGYRRGTTWEERTLTGKWTAILQDMAHKVTRYGDLSDAQVSFARKMLGWLSEAEVKRAEREAAKAAKVEAGAVLTAGRQVIEGEIVKINWKSNDFGGAWKITVLLDNGTKVWGSLPSALADTVEWESVEDEFKGKRITLTGTVEVKDDDPTFGFFKRPAKATLHN